jgi:lipopolysaccharide/colanic/teichoic acid biosynthesis glycosyltransferase
VEGTTFQAARAGQVSPGIISGAFEELTVVKWVKMVKRLMDILGAILGIILTWPVLVAAAVLVKLEDGGPVFFVQQRVGMQGKLFPMIKLRTMRVGAEQELERFLPFSAIQGPAYKIPNDPRITRVGRFFRRWSLDELPQFINILAGDMSLVGPRPEQTWVVEQFCGEQQKRLLVKPGLTGPMQINGRGLLATEERMRLELDYVEHGSLSRDLLILIRTIPEVISGRGAF